MATITKRAGKRGVRWLAEIRIKRGGKIVHREARTFAKQATARDWARDREAELAKPGSLDAVAHKGVTIGDLIRRYMAEVSALRPFGRSKDAALRMLAQESLAELDVSKLTAARVVEHVRQRRLAGTGPATVLNDVIWLRVVCKYARRAWGFQIDLQQIDDAADTLRDARLLARPKRRSRRPTADELRRMDAFFRQQLAKPRPWSIPMHLVMWLAIYSTRRLDELFRLRREDLDSTHGVYLVRDVKHPDGSAGNHREARMPERGWAVVAAILAQYPGETGPLLPWKSRSAGTLFQRACHLLGIEDLHFHDLRHHGVSILAEDGATIPELQQVSLHESWSSLSVYVNLPARRAERAEFEG